MINGSCSGLSDAFAQLVYYGVLSEQDAQCFRVESSIEPASYILLAAAVCLAFLNAFVMNANSQYNHDEQNDTVSDSSTLSHELHDEDEVAATQHTIRPSPVLFTDKFRWFLARAVTVKHTSLTSWRSERQHCSLQEEECDEHRPRPRLVSGNDRDSCMLGPESIAHSDPSFDRDNWLKNSSSLSNDSGDEPLHLFQALSTVSSGLDDYSVYTSTTSPPGTAVHRPPGLLQVSFDASSHSTDESSIVLFTDDISRSPSPSTSRPIV